MRGVQRFFAGRSVRAVVWLAVTAKVLAFAQPAVADSLQGTWVATKVEAEGKPAENLVGHRLTLDGTKFQIQSSDGNMVFAGTANFNPAATPATVDFVNTLGDLNGKTWKGIYAVQGDMLTICDNSPNVDAARPSVFDANNGSDHALFTFERLKQ